MDTHDRLAARVAIGSDGLPVVLLSTRYELPFQPSQYGDEIMGARQLLLAHCEDHFCKRASFSRVHHNTRGSGSFDIGTDGLPVVGAYHHASQFGLDEPGTAYVYAVHHCADVRCSVVDKTTVVTRFHLKFAARNSHETKLRIGENGFPTVVMKHGNAFQCARPEGCGPETSSFGDQVHITTDEVARNRLKKGIAKWNAESTEL